MVTVKCIKNLYRSTSNKNVFVKNKTYTIASEDNKRLYVIDENKRDFDFVKEKDSMNINYLFSDYFEILEDKKDMNGKNIFKFFKKVIGSLFICLIVFGCELEFTKAKHRTHAEFKFERITRNQFQKFIDKEHVLNNYFSIVKTPVRIIKEDSNIKRRLLNCAYQTIVF